MLRANVHRIFATPQAHGGGDKCIKAGCASKPIDREKLIETIQRHLAHAEAAPAV